MHIDARNLDNGALIEGDICIVGAGAVGISIALDWIDTPYKVILLEGGGFEYEDKIQELYAGKTTGQPYYPLKSARLHYFGGTSGHWGGMCTPLDPIDFEQRDWVPNSGWPINKNILDPFYARAQKKVEVGPYEYGLEYWQQHTKDLNPLPFEKEVVWNKMFQYSPPTRFGQRYKSDIVNAPNVHLYTFANCIDIRANDSLSSVTELTVSNFSGKKQQVRAKYFIMACCAIQNARMLLASNAQASKGLGNDNDLVGRYFMEHLEIKSAEIYLNHADPLNLYKLYPPKVRAELSITAEKQKEFRVLNGTASLMPLEIAKTIEPNIETWNKKDPREAMKNLEENHKISRVDKLIMRLTKDIYKAFELFTRIEQEPNPDCRVSLDVEKDQLGVPRAKLHWQLSPLDKYSIRTLYKLIGEQAGIAGIGRVRMMDYLHDETDFTWPKSTGGGWHHMGTTRMSEDPKTGVVDASCKVHGISNLYMAGSSCFPTGGSANPTLTAIALSLRLSDQVRDKLKNNI